MKRIALMLMMYLTVEQVCRNLVEGGIDPGIFGQRCRDAVRTFDTKDALADYLKSQYSPNYFCDGPCVKVYEATPIDYEVKVNTEVRKREVSETVESGREIKFK